MTIMTAGFKELSAGATLLLTIISSALYIGHFWGESDQSKADRPMLIERRDRESDMTRENFHRELDALAHRIDTECGCKP